MWAPWDFAWPYCTLTTPCSGIFGKCLCQGSGGACWTLQLCQRNRLSQNHECHSDIKGHNASNTWMLFGKVWIPLICSLPPSRAFVFSEKSSLSELTYKETPWLLLHTSYNAIDRSCMGPEFAIGPPPAAQTRVVMGKVQDWWTEVCSVIQSATHAAFHGTSLCPDLRTTLGNTPSRPHHYQFVWLMRFKNNMSKVTQVAMFLEVTSQCPFLSQIFSLHSVLACDYQRITMFTPVLPKALLKGGLDHLITCLWEVCEGWMP